MILFLALKDFPKNVVQNFLISSSDDAVEDFIVAVGTYQYYQRIALVVSSLPYLNAYTRCASVALYLPFFIVLNKVADMSGDKSPRVHEWAPEYFPNKKKTSSSLEKDDDLDLPFYHPTVWIDDAKENIYKGLAFLPEILEGVAIFQCSQLDGLVTHPGVMFGIKAVFFIYFVGFDVLEKYQEVDKEADAFGKKPWY